MAARLRFTYPLIASEKRQLYKYQEGKCAFCLELLDEPFKYADGDIVVDHDHKTNLVRGLVHNRCNRLIGEHDVITAEMLYRYMFIDYADRREELCKRFSEE